MRRRQQGPTLCMLYPPLLFQSQYSCRECESGLHKAETDQRCSGMEPVMGREEMLSAYLEQSPYKGLNILMSTKKEKGIKKSNFVSFYQARERLLVT